MKTKLAVIANITVVSCMSYFLYDAVSKDKQEKEQVELILEQVKAQEVKMAELQCLAENVYHEARNEGLSGQRAVAWATLNRVANKSYPNSVCDVVYQAELNDKGIPIRNKCQFSWYCDGKSDAIENKAAWNVAFEIADIVMSAYGKEIDPTDGAFMYHAHYVRPYWASSYDKTTRIDSHIFYN